MEIIESFKAYDLTGEPEINFSPNEAFSNHYSFEGDLRQIGYFNLFLSELMRIQGNDLELSSEKSIQQKHIDNAIRYIETSHLLGISVDSIAKYVGISKSYLFRLFREELGLSVQEYIIRVRMKSACNLLRQPDAQ